MVAIPRSWMSPETLELPLVTELPLLSVLPPLIVPPLAAPAPIPLVTDEPAPVLPGDALPAWLCCA